ncbi:MAG: DUF4118 domain-containing protein [Actinomycetes bacterium]
MVFLLGALAVLAVALAVVPFRDALGGSNVGILLVLVVVATASFGGRKPVIAVSIIAALTFNVLHTQPYLSLKIDARVDIVTTLLLVLVGLVAGEATERGWTARDSEQRRVLQIEELHRIAELASAALDAGAIWPTVRDLLCKELGLGRCWFEVPDRHGFPFPELTHTGVVARSREPMRWHPEGFELPRNGVYLSVLAEGMALGRLVMLPDPGHGLSAPDRWWAVAVADQFGMVAARTSQLQSLW